MVVPGVTHNDSDPDNDALTALLFDPPDNGVLSLNPDGSFTYSPNVDFNGTDSFSYVANDGLAESNIGTVVINVAPSG